MKIKTPIGEVDAQEIRRTLKATLRLFSRRRRFDAYFSIVGSGSVDFIIYQLGLRPSVPLVDLLYLEYLHAILRAGLADKLLIFPSPDLSYPDQDSGAFEQFKMNVLRVLRDQKARIDFIHPALLKEHTSDLVSCDFLQVVRYVGGHEFIEFLKNVLNWRGKSVSDFNKFHPADMRFLSTYVHLLRGWAIRAYLLDNGILSKPVSVGFLIWETEVDKLGVFRWMAQRNPMMRVMPILGKSISFRRRCTIPVFEPSKTVYTFDEMHSTISKLHNKQPSEIEQYIRILRTILAENYDDEVSRKVAYKEGRMLLKQQQIMNTDLADKRLGKKAYVALSLLHKLRERYDG